MLPVGRGTKQPVSPTAIPTRRTHRRRIQADRNIPMYKLYAARSLRPSSEQDPEGTTLKVDLECFTCFTTRGAEIPDYRASVNPDLR